MLGGARRGHAPRAHRRDLLSQRDRPSRPARLRWRVEEAHGLRRGHHRPGDPARPLRAAHAPPPHRRPLRGVVRDLARPRRRGRVHGRRRARHPHGQHGDLQREVGDPRQRRRGPVLQADDERLDLHGRRHRAGLRHRRAAHGHGDGPVPPDDARRERLPHHRGSARRGRASVERRGQAIHGGLRAQQDGARLARRRLARRADGDQRGARRRARRPGHLPRHHGRPAQARARGAARDREHRARLRRHRHHARADHDPARPALHHGRRQDRRRRLHADHGPVRGRRGRVRVGPRRQPARRELAARHADLRPALRRARRRAGSGR